MTMGEWEMKIVLLLYYYLLCFVDYNISNCLFVNRLFLFDNTVLACRCSFMFQSYYIF